MHNQISEQNIVLEQDSLEDMETVEHKFHLVDPSPWPILSSLSFLLTAVGAVLFLHNYAVGNYLLPLGLVSLLSCGFFWWRDVIKEGIEDKAHTNAVRAGMRLGMLLFILSEVMFFFAFFWSFFKANYFPMPIFENYWPVMAGTWPPAGIETLDAWNLPLLNTMILLLSGTTVTWAHMSLEKGDRKGLVDGLYYTVILGVLFSLLQAYEYSHAAFGFKDGIYPSNFYMATGFHGFHVMIGTVFLAVCYFRAKAGHFTKEGHLGFEFAAWYWHFVDVVWLFLFTFVYVLGS